MFPFQILQEKLSAKCPGKNQYWFGYPGTELGSMIMVLDSSRGENQMCVSAI